MGKIFVAALEDERFNLKISLCFKWCLFLAFNALKTGSKHRDKPHRQTKLSHQSDPEIISSYYFLPATIPRQADKRSITSSSETAATALGESSSQHEIR